MKQRYIFILSFLFFGIVRLSAQSTDGGVLPVPNVTLDSSNLPIVGIYTNFQSIPDEPKITADMVVIDNGYNKINHPTDTSYTYKGKIGIEMRGSISQSFLWPQKSYNVELRDIQGADSAVTLMGMPKESDWVLYGPYDDHALMRNVLTYQLVRQMGYWAPRTKYCELLLNTFLAWNYKGVYVMMEKIKRDKNRVNIAKLDSNDNAGDSLTGGYIVAVDKNINKPDSGWTSMHPQDTGVFFTYKYPSGDAITPPQKAYIKAYIDSFENVMSGPNFADPATGYRKFIDPTSFMDFFFIQELSKNLDAYKRSAYLTKDKTSKGGKLIAGPHWDYNSAFGAHLCGFDVDTGWAYPMTCWLNAAFPVPFWWERLLQDSTYTRDMKCRWKYLRSTVLDTVNIFHQMDSIAAYVAGASVRQYAQYNITSNYFTEVDTLKMWFRKRLAWMDIHMPGNCWNTAVEGDAAQQNPVTIYPNPSAGVFGIKTRSGKIGRVEVYDIFGRTVRRVSSDSEILNIDLSDQPTGIYFLKGNSGSGEVSLKLVKI
jgi:hypothetical protein